MFSRRAAASEGGFARDEAKRAVRRLLEKREQAVAAQSEKVAELRRVQIGMKNTAIRGAMGATIAEEEKKLAELRAMQEQLSQPLLSSGALTVDVLAEISAHELPLGRGSAKDEPTVYDIAIPSPDPSVPVPPQPTQTAVMADIYRESGMTYAGSRSGKGWFRMLTAASSPSNMLQMQSNAMETKLGRPLRPREVTEMQQRARATAMASASMLLGTFCCVVGAAFAGVVIWRKYGKPKTSEELAHASQQVQTAQNEREERLREFVGPVVSKVKLTAGAALHQHEGLANLAAGLSTATATRYVPPAAGAGAGANGKAAATARTHSHADDPDYAKIAAAEAAWQANGGLTSADMGGVVDKPS